MKKSKVNATIAKYFGFEESKGKKYKLHGKNQWTYPQDFPLHQGGMPNTSIPDFVQILEDYLELVKKHDYGCPRERFEDD